jgi:hypothetical protein
MSNQIIVVLPSGDPSAIGDAGNWILPNINLELDPQGEYEAALIDISFGNPGVTFNSVYVFLDFLDYSFIGSNQYQVLYKTAPMTWEPSAVPFYYEKETGTIHQWHKIIKKSINSVKCTVQQSTGDPVNTGYFTTITLAIRRIN